MTHSATLSALAARSGSSSFSPSPTVLVIEPGHGLEIPGGNFLLTADFHRVGGDLLLVGKDGHEVVVRDYFSSHNPPDLISGSGGVIHSDLAARLAGAIAPGQWAQDGAPQSQLHAIGEIQKLSGVVKVHHVDGTVETLQQGATVFQGDVLETAGDGSVGIVFADRSTFSLGKNGRMVMDELVYDPQAHTGHSSLSVVQGTFSFVSGQIAKSGPDAMSVHTPVMTIGIRGTTVAGTAAAEGSQNTVALLSDEDGGVGQIVVANQGGAPQVLTIPNQALQISSAFQAPPPPVVLPPQQLQNLIPELHNVQENRPPQPTSDPHINTSATNGNSSATQTAAAAPTTANGTTPTPTPEKPASEPANLSPDPPGTVQTPPSDPLLAPVPVLVPTPVVVPVVAPVVAPVVVPVVAPVVTPVSTPTATPVPTVTHTTTLTVTTPTVTQSIFLGTPGADTFIGSSGTNTFIGHGGNDVMTLGSSTNILVMDSHTHGEVVSDSVTSGVTNIVDASALSGGFAGAVANANGDLVISFDSAAGGGTSTFKNYFTTDQNVLTVIGNGSSDVMTFLKDTVGAQTADLVVRSGDGEFINTATAHLHEIVGTSGNDIIIGSTDDLILLGGSSATNGGASGKDAFILEGMGGAVIGGASGHNTAFFNHLPDSENVDGIFFDFTGDRAATITLGDLTQVANVAEADGKTTYLVNIHSVWGSNSGDTFVGGEGVAKGAEFSQDFHAGTGANTILDDSSVSNSEGLVRVTAIYETSSEGITADLSLFDGNRGNNAISWGGDSLQAYGYVYHDGVSDILYGVSQVEGSAFNDTLTGSSYGSYFVSSLGNDQYEGNTYNGLSAEQKAVEVSYVDSNSGVVINLTKGALIVTETLSSGSTVTAVLAAESAFHDGSYTDSLDNIEKVQLASGYSGKVYGDGTAVLDMSSSDITTMTANLTSGQAYGWQAGVTESFQNLGGLVDYSGSSDFVVTSTSLKTNTVWGNSSASTLDLTALGSSASLNDHVSNGEHFGTAYLVSEGLTTQLAYGGISALDISASAVIVASSYDNGGTDTMLGGAGNDSFFLVAGSALVDGKAGQDQLSMIYASSGVTVDMINHEVTGGAQGSFQNIEVIKGSSHNDLFRGDLDGTTFIGNGGTDELSYENFTGAVTVDMSSGHAWNASSGTDHLSGISAVQGSTGNDLIIGGTGLDTLYGGGGDDTLIAGTGGGTMIGGTGEDFEYGGFSSNVIIGGVNSTVDYHMASTGITANLVTGSVTGNDWSDTLINVEHVVGSTHDDVFIASAGETFFSMNPANWNMSTSASYSDAQTVTQTASNTLVFYQHDNHSFGEAGWPPSATWSFSTTATATGNVSVNWSFNGFDAWYLAHADAYFVDFTTGVSDHWDGTTNVSLSVTAGDVIGFQIVAGNYDGTNYLYNSITVSLDAVQSIDGGGGVDTLDLRGSTITDGNFSTVSNIEVVSLSNAVSVTLGAIADQAGVRTVDLSGDASIQSFDASGMTDGLTVIVPTAMLSGHSFQGNSSGTGVSDLRVTGDYAHLDGTNLGSVGKIDILELGGSNDTLTLTTGNVQSMTKGTNAAASNGSAAELLVIGDSTSKVVLNGWTDTHQTTTDTHGHSYEVYTHGGASVGVDSHISNIVTTT